MIDWSHPDYVANGYFHNTLKSVRIVCSDADHEATVTGYEFTGNDSHNIPVSSPKSQATAWQGLR